MRMRIGALIVVLGFGIGCGGTGYSGVAALACHSERLKLSFVRPHDCTCAENFVHSGDQWAVDHNVYLLRQTITGSLTVFFSDSTPIPQSEIPFNDGSSVVGMYRPDFDQIYLAYGGRSLVHELIHRYRIRRGRIPPQNEAEHTDWDRLGYFNASAAYKMTNSIHECER